ncbi:MAG: hypothetical protein NT020_13305 [Chloroflexales bacterium]|nr:hypothetical protein [Chloroflexales bacterium]
MTNTKRDWVRTIGITGATLLTIGALTMGGLFAANATGVISLPAGRGSQMMGRHGGHGGQMMGRHGGHGGQMMGRHGGHGGQMMGGRGGHDGMMGGGRGQGGKMGKQGHGGMMQFGGQATAADAQVLQHTLHMLQQEQALANALGTSNPTAKAIAASRATDIATISNWLKTWYPNEMIPTHPSASGTVVELRLLMQHHDLKIDQIATNGEFEHPELQKWLADSLKQRARDVSTLFDTQTS